MDMKSDWQPRDLGFEGLIGPLDRSLAHVASKPTGSVEVKLLRWFWLDGLFSTVSVSFYTSFVALFAVAYGANNVHVGRLAAIASLAGLVALLPGAQAIKLFIPLAWMAARAPWQVLITNFVAGIVWTGYSLASFNLLLDMAPEAARAEANALFQLVVAGSAVITPVLGGHMADAFGYKPIFILSFGLRILGAVAFLWWVAKPAARRVRSPAGVVE